MPPLDAESMALLNYFLATQTNLDPLMQNMLGGLISPNVNKSGELDQFGVDLEKTNLNQYQDIAGTFGNPMNTLLSGLGAVGPAPLGGGVVGGGGLNPITTETVMETPATLQTRYLAQLYNQGQPGQRSLEGLVAAKLIGDPERGIMPQTPTLIMADLQAKLANPEASELDANEAALFKNSLPQKDVLDAVGNPTGETTIDWNATRKWIEEQAAPFQQEQGKLLGPNITQNSYGQYVSLSEQPSEMMQYLQKLGLPDPRAEYGIDFSVQSDPELSELLTSIGVKGQAFEGAKKSYEKYLKNKPIAQSMARRFEESEADRRAQTQQGLRDYFSAMSARGTGPVPMSPGNQWPTEEPVPQGQRGVGNQWPAVFEPQPGQRGYPQWPTEEPVPQGRMSMMRPPMPELNLPSQRSALTKALLGGNLNVRPSQEYALAGQMNQAARSQGEDMLAMVRAIAPGYGARSAGRSPFKDAIMQRLQPILAAGGARR